MSGYASSAENYYYSALSFYQKGMNGDAKGALKQAYEYAKKITDSNTKRLILDKLDSLNSKI